MSRPLISRSPDLLRLRAEGLNLAQVGGHVAVWDVPYLGAERRLLRGRLISTLTLKDDEVVTPDDHTVLFDGEMPHDQHGNPMRWMLAGDGGGGGSLSDGSRYRYQFSQKPASGAYPDYYRKFQRYLGLLVGAAQALYPEVTAATRQPVDAEAEDSVFILEDTWSPRARISGIVDRVKSQKIAIVGVGGTGAHVLDLVAKTAVREIHLFDGDSILQRNILRLPGATSRETVRDAPNKATHYAGVYSALRRGVHDHPHYLDSANLNELEGTDFVFLCVDKPQARGLIANWLDGHGIPFIDAGMGLNVTDDDKLTGLVRTTLVEPGMLASAGLPVGDIDLGDDIYDANIQTVDLNCLNAAFAVIAWKRRSAIYAQVRGQRQSLYTLSSNKVHSRADH